MDVVLEYLDKYLNFFLNEFVTLFIVTSYLLSQRDIVNLATQGKIVTGTQFCGQRYSGSEQSVEMEELYNEAFLDMVRKHGS